MITRVKGTQDFLNLKLFNFIIISLKKHLSLYHFTEIQTPLIEHLSLFQRSLGQNTDVISKEMFIIESRQAEDTDRICLRPEMTASIVRAFNENRIQQIPWKVFSYGPCFRYERPQKGRFRQFHQCTIETIGTPSIIHDVECITLLDRFFHETLTLNNYILKINFLGCNQDRASSIALLHQFLESAAAKNICGQCCERKNRNIMRIFDCKNNTCQEIYRNAPSVTDTLCTPCNDEWNQLQTQLSLLSVSFIHSKTLVRGLDYYNKTVFEFSSKNLGAQDAFCGGGRYNQLAQELGARQDYPAIGAAIGLERLMLLLEPLQNILLLDTDPLLNVIIARTSAQQSLALLLADSLRAEGIVIDILSEGSMKSMLRKAHALNAAHVLIVGETEQQNGTVTIKNMTSGTESTVPQIEAAALLKTVID